ncbi:hypothetical protein N0V84_009348 [Fusarium piperis]|uniref:Uncharacterized protein n=1 Tax=Fusarium piperis TaxID=1435070 RepID=A0A9W8W6I2_9HYPO|nr:hypothetical protein N0V84_009348 [Fusarium piperis]
MAPARHEPSSLLDLQAFHRPRGFCQTETWSSRSRSHPNSGSSSYGFFKDSDFLAALTCIADLYSKPDVLPMRLADSASDEEQFITGQGALARVTRRNTDVDLPSSAQANQVQRRTLRLATKKYKDQCWDANGEPIDHNAKSLLTELTILSHSGNIPLPSPRLELADWNLSEFLQK